jgi:integrase/recombinase XerD
VKLHVAALRFFFVKTLKRTYLLDDIPYPKVPRRLPVILSVEEVAQLIDGARTLTLDRVLSFCRSNPARATAAPV